MTYISESEITTASEMTSRIWIFNEGTREGHYKEGNRDWVMKGLMLTEDTHTQLLKGNGKPGIMHTNQSVCVCVCACSPTHVCTENIRYRLLFFYIVHGFQSHILYVLINKFLFSLSIWVTAESMQFQRQTHYWLICLSETETFHCQ